MTKFIDEDEMLKFNPLNSIPSVGETYYVPLVSSLTPSFISLVWTNNTSDIEYLKHGLVFKDKQKALAKSQSLIDEYKKKDSLI